jgi:hypothetical protein
MVLTPFIETDILVITDCLWKRIKPMTSFARGHFGRFTNKSDEPRKVRSVNLTDAAWDFLLRVGEDNGMSRNDFLETLAQRQQYPFMEVEETQLEPVMETVQLTSGELLNQLRAQHPKLKLTLRDFERVLNFLRQVNG